MGFERRENRIKDELRRERRDAARNADGSNELDGQTFKRLKYEGEREFRDRRLTKQLVEARDADTSPDKAGFIRFLREKRYGQFFNAAHFNVAITGLTPKNDDSIEHFHKRVQAAEKLAENLLRCPEKLKPMENASILFCLARLGVKNDSCLERCLQQTREDLSSLDAMALNSVVYAITRHRASQPAHDELLRDVCSRMHYLLGEDGSLAEYQKRDVAIDHVHHLGRYRAHSEKIFSSVSRAIIAELWEVDPRAVGIVATAATKVNWSCTEFFKFAEQIVTATIQAPPDTFLEGKDAVGLSSIIRSLEVFERGIDSDAIDFLREQIDAGFKSYTARDRVLIAHQLVPVLMSKNLVVSQKMLDCISDLREIGDIPSPEAYTLEKDVGAGLKRLGMNFKGSSFKAGFELDFLIDIPGRGEINLELDGRKAHSVLLLDGDASIGAQAPCADRYRDTVLNRVGIEVIRLPVRQWLKVAPLERPAFLAHLLE